MSKEPSRASRKPVVAGLGRGDVVALGAQPVREGQDEGRLVLHQQHAGAHGLLSPPASTRQLEDDGRAPALAPLHVDAAAVRAHDVPDEAQAEAAAGCRVPLRGRSPEEGLEDPLALVARDARSAVLDPHHDHPLVRP